jgi:hypothetical protein
LSNLFALEKWPFRLGATKQMLKNVVLQWGEMPTSVAFIGIGEIMGWGNKAIEIRNVETGHLDGVFMHKKAQRLKFLCERNDKVKHFFFSLFRFIDSSTNCVDSHFRCFSRRPKEARRGRSISWFSTSPEWRIGKLTTE